MKMIQPDVVRKGESEDYYRGYEDGKRDAVKHGCWIPLNHMYHVLTHDEFWRCSECLKASLRTTDYCPFCGAKMDFVVEGLTIKGNENG